MINVFGICHDDEFNDNLKSLCKRNNFCYTATHFSYLILDIRHLCDIDDISKIIASNMSAFQISPDNPKEIILFVGDNLKPATVIELSKYGLIISVDFDEMAETIEAKHKEKVRKGEEPDTARITAVVGVSGGVGASFLSLMMAGRIGADASTKCLLVSTDLSGSISRFIPLGEERNRTALVEMLKNPHRAMDANTIEASTIRFEGAYVLADDGPITEIRPDSSVYSKLLAFSTHKFDNVIVDVKNDDLSILKMSGNIIIVLDEGIHSITNAFKVKEYVTQHNPDAKMLFVINKCGQYKKSFDDNDVKKLGDYFRVKYYPNEIYSATLEYEMPTKPELIKSIDGLVHFLTGNQVKQKLGLLAMLKNIW